MRFVKVGLHILITLCGVGAILIGSQTYGIVTTPNVNLNKLAEKEVSAPHGDKLITAGGFLILAGVMLAGFELIPEDGLEFFEPAVPALTFKYQDPKPPSNPAPADSPREADEDANVWDNFDPDELAEALNSIETSYNTKQTA